MACVVSAVSGISECMSEEMVNETKQQPTSKREEAYNSRALAGVIYT